MKEFYRFSKAAIVVLTVFLGTTTAFAEPAEGELTLRVHGFSDGVGFMAHREALENAKQEAMREILRAKVASGDSRPFRSMIRKAYQYVTRVDELQLSTHSGRTQVEVDAYVDLKSVDQDLAALVLPRLPEPPKVSCLIAVDDGVLMEVPADGITESALVKGLKNLGLNPSPHTESGDIFNASDFHEAVLGDVATSAAYARETLADAVLIGVVSLERSEVPDAGTPARTRATLNIKVFRGHDGDLIDAFIASAAITGLDAAACREEVLEDVASKVLGDVTVATVLSVLSLQKNDEVLITLRNPGSRSRVTALTDMFQGEPEIDTIENAYYSERLARIRLGYSGSMGYLVDLIRDRDYEGWPLVIQEVVGREMNLIFETP